jgi:hypothetical protein
MVQRLNEAFQIANAIAVAVFVAAHKNFHERAVMPTLLEFWFSLMLIKCRPNGQCTDEESP